MVESIYGCNNVVFIFADEPIVNALLSSKSKNDKVTFVASLIEILLPEAIPELTLNVDEPSCCISVTQSRIANDVANSPVEAVSKDCPACIPNV